LLTVYNVYTIIYSVYTIIYSVYTVYYSVYTIIYKLTLPSDGKRNVYLPKPNLPDDI